MSQDIIGSNSNVTCSYQPHTANGEEVWSERRGGAGTNLCQICPLGWGWPWLKHQTTTPKSPCGSAEDKWLSGITEKWI